MLRHYATHFHTAEINATYYAIPGAAVFEEMHRKTGSGFEFMVKLHQEATHKRTDGGSSQQKLANAVRPLREAGKLRGLVAQFPWSFRATPANRDYLEYLHDRCGDTPLFVEFRHDTWLTDPTFRLLQERGIGYICVDEPPLPGLLPPQDVTTTDVGYVRLHGRNAAAWWDGAKGDRYDYRYAPTELEDWVPRLKSMGEKTRNTYVFFNNCYQGHAVKNAQMLIEMLKTHLSDT